MKNLIILTIILFTVQFTAPIFAQTEQKVELVIETGHTDSIKSVAFSPDGNLIASGSDDFTVKLWNPKTCQELRTLTGHSGRVVSVAFSPDSKTLASAGYDKRVKIWDIATGLEIFSTKQRNPIISVAFSPNGKLLGVRMSNYVYQLEVETKKWHELPSGYGFDIGTVDYYWLMSDKLVAYSQDGKTIASPDRKTSINQWNIDKDGYYQISSPDIVTGFVYSPNSKTIGYTTFGNDVYISDAISRNLLKTFRGHTNRVYSIDFSPDGKLLVSSSWDGSVKLWNIETEREIKSINCGADRCSSVVFSPDGQTVAVANSNNQVRLINLNGGKEITNLAGNVTKTVSLAFSPQNKILASGGNQDVTLWNLETGRLEQTIDFSREILSDFTTKQQYDPETVKHGWINIKRLGFSPDKKSLGIQIQFLYRSGPYMDLSEGGDSFSYNLLTREKNVDLSYSEKSIINDFINSTQPSWNETSLTTSNNSKKIKAKAMNNYIMLFDEKTEQEILRIVKFNDESWIITTPEGRFDTNKSLDRIKGLHWFINNEILNPLPLEIFMRDYYEPNLLLRMLKCNEENNCDQEFKPVRNLTELNRTQPKVKIAEIKATTSADVVQIKVEAKDVESEFQKDKQNLPLHSGVFDLRLFRDGQLVGYSTADEKLQATFKTYKDAGEELNVWQAANHVELANGKKTFTFNVRLPKNRDAKEFNFTTYAFNSDRVKSETDSQTYTLPEKLPTAKGNAYLITIGVNANEDRRYDLRYAANDARKLQDVISKNLPKEKYRNIVQIPLISDYDKDGKLIENNATKAKIKGVLDKLSGKTVPAEALKDIPNKDLLAKVQPEDLVLIAFSGHGYADQNGIFYLIPSDIGKSASGGLTSVLPKSISSDELSLWLRDIDAGEMMMIVDACHSAAAVQGAGFKPGPMGSRGLGQLSYDKGMRILTATQADNVALELGNLQQGLLTYSLVKNGIELGLADDQPKDNKLFSNEWLGFAVKDVPNLYQAIKDGKRGVTIGGKNIPAGASKGIEIISPAGQKSNLNLQQPSLFDFSRRDKRFELMKLSQ